MLFYTGAIQYEDMQDNPSLSLGGYKSASQIPNGEINNLFPKITQQSVIQNKRVVRMIVFKNTIGQNINNLKIWSANGLYSLISMAFIKPGVDGCQNPIFEKIGSETALPYQGEFNSFEEEAPYTVEELLPEEMFGIWIKRELNTQSFTDLDKGLDDKMSCEELEEQLQALNTSSIEKDEVKLFFEWD